MKLHVKANIDHFIKDMFADILRSQSLIKSEVEYEGLFQIVAAELRAAKYCWDELFKRQTTLRTRFWPMNTRVRCAQRLLRSCMPRTSS